METGEGMGIMNYVPGAFLGVSQFRLGEWDAFWDTSPARRCHSTPTGPSDTTQSALWRGGLH